MRQFKIRLYKLYDDEFKSWWTLLLQSVELSRLAAKTNTLANGSRKAAIIPETSKFSLALTTLSSISRRGPFQRPFSGKADIPHVRAVRIKNCPILSWNPAKSAWRPPIFIIFTLGNFNSSLYYGFFTQTSVFRRVCPLFSTVGNLLWLRHASVLYKHANAGMLLSRNFDVFDRCNFIVSMCNFLLNK